MEAAEIMAMLRREQAKPHTPSSTTSADFLAEYGLGGVDCPDCGNTGLLIRRGPGILELHTQECPCMRRRRSLRALRKAGMADMGRRYTFESYLTDTPRREEIKKAAQRFAAADTGWFFISGRSGSGKTHICCAICTGLMERGGTEIGFMPWREEATALKTGIGDRAWYEGRIRRLKRVPVLYVDDLFKGGATEADVRLAFEILNARYNDTALRTLISSELDMNAILRIDEATGGRIYERSRGFAVRAPDEDLRLRP